MLKKALLATVLVLALGFGAAHAYQIDSLASSLGPVPPTFVSVNPGGLGDALIYGYYNVREGNTYFAVTNTSPTYGAEVRIRFREAENVTPALSSQEVLDFDICLSPNDVWTGVIKSDSADAGRLFSRDDDTYINATNPPNFVTFFDEFPDGVQFKFGANNPTTGITADMTREGYFEVIGMRRLREVITGGDCGPNLLRDTVGANYVDVPNDLMGQLYIAKLASGELFGYAATALADFRPFTFAGLDPAATQIGSVAPDFATESEDGTINPVNFALTKRTIRTVYDLQDDPDLNGRTEVVITFPTKHQTKSPGLADDIFDDDRVRVTVFDDAENSPVSTCEFSPCPEGVDVRLPFEVNVINLNASNILDSNVEVALSTAFHIGWMEFDFARTNTSVHNPAHQTTYNFQTTIGWPAIGFVLHTFDSNIYTGSLPVQYTSDVIAP